MSERIIPKAGVYQGQLNGQMSIYEADSGSLCLAVPVKLLNAEVAWTGKATVTLIKSDGVGNENSIAKLREIWDGWNTQDPFDLLELEGRDDVIFECDCVQEEYTAEGKEPELKLKVKWLNPIGGSSRIPQCMDRKEALAKFGAKFKAMFGGTSKPAQSKATGKPAASKPVEDKPKPAAAAATTTKKKSSAPPPPAAVSRGAGGTAVTCTMDEAWQRLQELYPDSDDEALGKIWYAKLKELYPDVEPSDLPSLSLQQWGAAKVALEEAFAG